MSFPKALVVVARPGREEPTAIHAGQITSHVSLSTQVLTIELPPPRMDDRRHRVRVRIVVAPLEASGPHPSTQQLLEQLYELIRTIPQTYPTPARDYIDTLVTHCAENGSAAHRILTELVQMAEGTGPKEG